VSEKSPAGIFGTLANQLRQLSLCGRKKTRPSRPKTYPKQKTSYAPVRPARPVLASDYHHRENVG
jgi:hypothetical protein